MLDKMQGMKTQVGVTWRNEERQIMTTIIAVAVIVEASSCVIHATCQPERKILPTCCLTWCT
jgi:hypothetical protein